MPVLIGCEESQVITKAMRSAGVEAYSCDIRPTRGNHDWHFQQDIMEVLPLQEWDLTILHPDCTAMAVSGNRWYGAGKPYHQKRLEAIAWTLSLWELAKKYSEKVALEKPVSVIFTHLPNVFYIQPWEHGHGETKKTGFALHNLPPLTPTNIVDGREQRIWRMPPSKNRKRDRSVTFEGVALAIVEQWAYTGGRK